MYILGISAYYHDSAACLVKDGEIVAAVQEERFSRKKHDPNFPQKAISYCLEYAGISPKDLEYVAYYEKPIIKFDRLIKTYLMYAPLGFRSYITAMPIWLRQKLWIRREIRNKVGFYGKLICPEHHVSHAASAFYPSPFNKAAFLTMDGVGEWTTTSFGIGHGNQVDIHSEIRFPHSLGLLYSAFTYYTGFRVNSGEYKLMGLAPYGEPKYAGLILDHLIDLKEDGSFRLNMEYFNYCTGLTMTNERFDSLFGRKPRKPESEISKLDMDLASSIQFVTEEIVLRIGKHVHKKTGEKKLCLAGGVALNCVANGRLYNEGPFEKIWIQPASGDAGGALGAALHVWYQILDNQRKINGNQDSQKGSYLGTYYSDDVIKNFIEQRQLPHTYLNEDELYERISELIIQEKVIGWFDGRMEFGPRALGSRSIIGDARSSKMQSVMNLKIKYRESFRPFAPAVMSEKMPDWFVINNSKINKDFSSPYMLMVGHVVEEKRTTDALKTDDYHGVERVKSIRSQIPAVTHVDYSARFQTVHRETNPKFYRLLEVFDKKTGCPVLINTSFNVRGEPIVESPQDAYRCFMRTEMDYLIMGSYLFDKTEQPAFTEPVDWRKEFKLD